MVCWLHKVKAELPYYNLFLVVLPEFICYMEKKILWGEKLFIENKTFLIMIG